MVSESDGASKQKRSTFSHQPIIHEKTPSHRANEHCKMNSTFFGPQISPTKAGIARVPGMPPLRAFGGGPFYWDVTCVVGHRQNRYVIRLDRASILRSYFL